MIKTRCSRLKRIVAHSPNTSPVHTINDSGAFSRTCRCSTHHTIVSLLFHGISNIRTFPLSSFTSSLTFLLKHTLYSHLQTSNSSLMPCLKYNVSFLSLTQMQSKSEKFNLGSEWPQCEVYVVFLVWVLKVHNLIFSFFFFFNFAEQLYF